MEGSGVGPGPEQTDFLVGERPEDDGRTSAADSVGTARGDAPGVATLGFGSAATPDEAADEASVAHSEDGAATGDGREG